MNIEDYQDLINNKEYDTLYDEISNKVNILIKELLCILNIEIEDFNYKDIEYQIQSKTLLFASINIICNILNEYQDEELVDNINTIIKEYNGLIKIKEEYLNKQKEIKNTKNKIEDILDNYRMLFKTMLRYKNKDYNSNWTYKELIEKINIYYAYFYNDLKILSSLVNSNEIIIDSDLEVVTINDIEKIIILERIYEKIQSEYRKYANYYKDIELEEGQTINDLLDYEDEKYIELYKEMLDYKDASYEEEDLENLVFEHYPEYKKDLTFVHSAALHSKSPVEVLNEMERVYNNIKNRYK